MAISRQTLYLGAAAAVVVAALGVPRLLQSQGARPPGPFRIEEATIADVHRAIQQGADHLPRRGAGLHRSRQGV